MGLAVEGEMGPSLLCLQFPALPDPFTGGFSRGRDYTSSIYVLIQRRIITYEREKKKEVVG
ncbi:RNA-dependent RNA polymerase [Sesbania bispinosa]|nr:RNA-dependent RNA polymerase [Sesbania bispinosa]